MTQPAKAQEPSMEEILASIRRIIADDDATKTPPRAPEPPKSEPEPAPPQPVFSAPPPAPPVVPPRPRFEAEAARALAPSSPPEIATVADQASDILDLTESMAAPMPMPQPPSPPPANHSANAMPNPAAFRTIDGSSDVDFDESSERPGVTASSDQERGRLVSGETSAAVDSAFNALAQTVLVQNARTLEDLVREMLRPMLKTWLDDNLPGMVERLVRAEIERVSRGRAP
jgi:cell pole-organizing protein PopZ